MNMSSFANRTLRILPCAFLLGLCTPFTTLAHEEESRVAIELETSSQVSAGKVSVEFQLVDTKEKTVLGSADLNVTHEKSLHVLAYDSALKEFRHVHPEFDGNLWKVDLDLSTNGSYFFWAQGQLASDSEEFSTFTRLNVSGGSPAWPAPALTEIRTGKETGSVATLSNQKLRAGKMAMLTLKFTREDGSSASIAPYLGAFAHVVATPDDGDSLVHVHPMDGNKPNEGMLHVTFARAGFYRVWVQFIDGDTLKVIPLSVEVSK